MSKQDLLSEILDLIDRPVITAQGETAVAHHLLNLAERYATSQVLAVLEEVGNIEIVDDSLRSDTFRGVYGDDLKIIAERYRAKDEQAN